MSRVVGPMHELNRKASRPSGEELPTEATGRSVSKHVILAGVPIGAAVGSLIPKDLLSYGSVAFASILAVLSLVALRRHVVAFALRLRRLSLSACRSVRHQCHRTGGQCHPWRRYRSFIHADHAHRTDACHAILISRGNHGSASDVEAPICCDETSRKPDLALLRQSAAQF